MLRASTVSRYLSAAGFQRYERGGRGFRVNQLHGLKAVGVVEHTEPLDRSEQAVKLTLMADALRNSWHVVADSTGLIVRESD